MSTLSFQQPGVRQVIFLSYWLVVFVALRLWWSTTSIERLSLPESRVQNQATRTLHLPIDIKLEGDWSEHQRTEFSKEIQTLQANAGVSGQSLGIRVSTAASTVKTLHLLTSLPLGKAILPHPCKAGPLSHLLVRILSFIARPTLERIAESSAEWAHLVSELLALESKVAEDHTTFKHSPRYRLAFSLLNEDAAAGGAITEWPAEAFVARYITPTCDRLSGLHNFTVESQLRFHAPLAFEPQVIPSGENAHGLSPADLTVFVNSAEWSLSSSVSNDPVLHFLAFVPSAEHRPLRILDAAGYPTSSVSFVLPQWGGVVIVNPDADAVGSLSVAQLRSTFETFRDQLSTLLGVRPLPPGVVLADEKDVISDWQLDALMRRRALESVHGSQETLSSIVKLVHQIENMPVGRDVKDDIQDSLSALDKVFASANTPIEQLVSHASSALTLASRAFFNPGMLALLYFPPEHTYAVYTPMFLPMAVPLIASLAKEFPRWRQTRKKAPAVPPP